ncbi:MAG: TlpA family protein disulfide reductase [Actinobacteria bacterium]|nr:TlpA family protein disulfide reductase [Actinomycetota bacterium]
MVLGTVFALIGLGLLQLRRVGTGGIPNVTVANYRAVARVDDRPAPDFTASSLAGGGDISLRDFRGEVVVLNFWASWCVPCRQEAPHLQALWERYGDEGVQLLGVDYRDDPAAAKAYEREFGITFPSVEDPAGSLAGLYELLGVPTTFLIDVEGRIVYRFTGRIDGEVLGRAVDEVLGQAAT